MFISIQNSQKALTIVNMVSFGPVCLLIQETAEVFSTLKCTEILLKSLQYTRKSRNAAMSSRTFLCSFDSSRDQWSPVDSLLHAAPRPFGYASEKTINAGSFLPITLLEEMLFFYHKHFFSGTF